MQSIRCFDLKMWVVTSTDTFLIIKFNSSQIDIPHQDFDRSKKSWSRTLQKAEVTFLRKCFFVFQVISPPRWDLGDRCIIVLAKVLGAAVLQTKLFKTL